MEEGVVYVSIPFATAVHRCCCGCGNQVVTPLDPDLWQLTFDGKGISLSPSIGNWGFQCGAHYWIRRNQVLWTSRWYGEAKEGSCSRGNGRHRKKTPQPGRTLSRSPMGFPPRLWRFLTTRLGL